jgi:hypothetical protein
MYTKALRKFIIGNYACGKELLSSKFILTLFILAEFVRFQYPHDYEKPRVVTRFPG